jgi:hypothetical protein
MLSRRSILRTTTSTASIDEGARMTTHRILSVEMKKTARAGHETVAAVHVAGQSADAAKRWTLPAVLQAMNSADRFYTEASNGRHARVQRYNCGQCGSEHIRTHISDGAIDDMRLHKTL